MGITAGGLAEIEKKKKTVDQVILDPNIFIKEFPLDPWTPYLVTNRFIQQTITRLLAYNPDEKMWIRVNVDSDGNLIFTRSARFYLTEPTALSETAYAPMRIDSRHYLMTMLSSRDATDIKVFDAVSLDAYGTLTHPGEDVSDYGGKTLLISTTQDCTVYVQFSDDNTNWYDWCDAAGVAMSFSVNNAKKAMSIDDYCHYIRIVVYNAAASAATVTGVISCVV